MHRCPGCDQPNHGSTHCEVMHQPVYHPNGHYIRPQVVQEETQAPPTRDTRLFIGSGEDAWDTYQTMYG